MPSTPNNVHVIYARVLSVDHRGAPVRVWLPADGAVDADQPHGELELASGGQTYRLRYFHPNSGSYAALPKDSADGSVAYVIGDAFPGNGSWITASHDLGADVATEFGFTDFTVEAVRIGNLQERTGTSPFSNITTYWDDTYGWRPLETRTRARPPSPPRAYGRPKGQPESRPPHRSVSRSPSRS